MAYIGAEPLTGQNREVDDISSSFNGSTTAFTLQVSSVNVSPESANNILISLGGVIQNPGNDYTIDASTITFTTAPASGLDFFGLILGAGINTATVADSTITGAKLSYPLTLTGDVNFDGATAGRDIVFDRSDNALEFADDAKLVIGSGGDVNIRHSGNRTIIRNHGIGQINIDLLASGNAFAITKANLTETIAKFTPDGSVDLYFDDVKRCETTSSGITVTGTVTETSDIAFKSDIEPITNTLDKLQQITGYKYKLDNASIDSMGVIAQDVEKVFPELVHGDEGSKTLQYSGLIGVLVEAVKDLSAKVKALESN